MTQKSEMPTEGDDWKPRRKKRNPKGGGDFRLEYRMRPEQTAKMNWKWAKDGWRKHWRKYRTKERREAAMIAMNKKNDLFEYRIPKGEE